MSKIIEMKKQEVVSEEVTKVFDTIMSYAMNSRYNNITDYRLYSILRVKPADVRDALNMLYQQGLITVKTIDALRPYKVITPTSSAYKKTAENRPVSKDVCKKVFLAVMKYEYENTKWLNVTAATLERTVGYSVGVITLANALTKLLKAGYIETKVVGSMTVYNSTELGRRKAMAR